MISTTEMAPSLGLASFVRCYAYREFNTNGRDVVKPWYASQEPYIPFFFKAVPVRLVDSTTGHILKTGKNCGVVGMSSQYNGEMTFNGAYSFFQVIFMPNGFSRIFNIPSNIITDQIVWAEEIFDIGIKFLHEQLAEAHNLAEMVGLANIWLMNHLNKHKYCYKDPITATSNLILKARGLINLDQLARDANMSARTFERHFNAAIGMTPKQLCCITRFNYALKLKLNNPCEDWTSIAHRSGYFDQMHLIKDFKRFCGVAPASLIKHVPLLEEKYLKRVDGR